MCKKSLYGLTSDLSFTTIGDREVTYIHAARDKNAASFRGTCKNVFYLIQNLHYLESGHFILRKKDLKEVVEEDRIILELADLPDGYDFGQAFSSLFTWCQRAFARIERLGGTCYEP